MTGVFLGDELVPFSLVRSDRKSLGITVNPDSSLTVTAPQDVSEDAILERLRQRGPWILRSRRAFDALRPRTPPRQYLSGETHWFKGREYRLRVDPERAPGVELTATHLIVGGIDPSETSRVRNRVQNWYQREGRAVMSARYAEMLRTFPCDARPRLIVRPMEKRWGSLTPGGRALILNRRLAEVDHRLIDYVIVHELCHLVHPDHGAGFLKLLGDQMPDWPARKDRLERQML
ncbi:SprT family zinc-dependent metalloprotease [Sphingomonas sp. ZT3P38]|uniref:M48 family metallopeptidase n=1 Tax=Parasphingomonas zepuensis TaxID=3096161 RepID=UPI002FCB138A